jgi:CRP/FNR family cyclic AMP-dependent transcriptional regulator
MRTAIGSATSESCQTCTLRGDGFFCNLSQNALKALDAIKFSTSYPSGAVLFAEGDAARGVMVLCKGRVKISMTSIDGKTLILRVARAGEVLGLHSVVSSKACQATVETLELSQVNFFRREDFLRFLREHGEASLMAAQHLSKSYEIACDQVRSIGLSNSAPEKLARFLLDWSAQGPQQAGPGVRAVLTLTHEEIGQMIGTSRETVTRTLGDFKAQRLACLKGAVLNIPDRAALEHLANV